MTTMQYFYGIQCKYWSNPVQVLKQNRIFTRSQAMERCRENGR